MTPTDHQRALEDIRFVRKALTKQWINKMEREFVEETHAAIHRIEAALQSVAGDGWRPIDSAPRDRTTIFACDDKNGHRGLVSFNGREWECVHPLHNTPMGVGFYPTHWRDEPAQPAGEGETP